MFSSATGGNVPLKEGKEKERGERKGSEEENEEEYQNTNTDCLLKSLLLPLEFFREE